MGDMSRQGEQFYYRPRRGRGNGSRGAKTNKSKKSGEGGGAEEVEHTRNVVDLQRFSENNDRIPLDKFEIQLPSEFVKSSPELSKTTGKIPALHPFWMKEILPDIFPSSLLVENTALVFLPQDNFVDDRSAFQDLSLSVEERFTFLSQIVSSLEQLLFCKLNVFWSLVLYFVPIQNFLISFLSYAVRRHEKEFILDDDDGSYGSELQDIIEDSKNLSVRLYRAVLLIFHRLTRQEESVVAFFSLEGFRELLTCPQLSPYLFTPASLIDLLTLFSLTNPRLTSEIFSSVWYHRRGFRGEFTSLVPSLFSESTSLLVSAFRREKTNEEVCDLAEEDIFPFLADVVISLLVLFMVDLSLVDQEESARDREKKENSLIHFFLSTDDVRGDPLLMKNFQDLFLCLYSSSTFDDENPKRMEKIRPLVAGCLLQLVNGYFLDGQTAKFGVQRAFEEFYAWGQSFLDALSANVSEGHHEPVIEDLRRAGVLFTFERWQKESSEIDLDRLEFLKKSLAQTASLPTIDLTAMAQPSGISLTEEERTKIVNVKDVVAEQYGEGFIFLCLQHFGWDVSKVLDCLFGESLPNPLCEVDPKLSLQSALSSSLPPTSEQVKRKDSIKTEKEQKERNLLKRRILDYAANQTYDETMEDNPWGNSSLLYEDEWDDTLSGMNSFVPPPTAQHLSSEEDDEAGDGEEKGQMEGFWGPDKLKGGRPKTVESHQRSQPVVGQTLQARRKHENKGRVANHNRREGNRRKMQRHFG